MQILLIYVRIVLLSRFFWSYFAVFFEVKYGPCTVL